MDVLTTGLPNSGRWSGWSGSAMLMIVGILFLSMAADKALAPRDTALVLVYFLGRDQHPFLISSLTIGLLVFELILGVGLITMKCWRTAVIASVATLVCFSGVLAWMMLDPAAPGSCGCGRMFGVIKQAESGAPLGLARNGVLLCLTVVGASLVRVSARSG